MAHHIPVPSDADATSIVDLVNDCRQVASVLGHTVIDLTGAAISVPLARLPFSFGAMPVEITEDLLVSVHGFEDY